MTGGADLAHGGGLAYTRLHLHQSDVVAAHCPRHRFLDRRPP